MTETPPPDDTLGDEFRDLGKNFVKILHDAWDRPERRKLQQELESSLTEMADTLKREAQAAAQSPTGQRIRTEIDDLGEKVRSGQVESKVREELLSALKSVNAELEKVSRHLGSTPADQPEAPMAPPEAPTSPPEASTAGSSPENPDTDVPGTGG